MTKDYENSKHYDVSVSIWTNTGRPGARFLAGVRGFLLFQTVQIGSKAQPASCFTTEGFFP
jgi:hypothetical protein